MINKSRITMLREILGMSQKEFAYEVGITQGALSQLESGNTSISLHTLQKMSLAVKANCNWLVNGKGDIFLSDSPGKKIDVRSSILQVELDDSSLIPLVKEEAHAGYIRGYQDKEYIKALDVYKIPGFDKGNYRLFEISGDSMLPTIHPREIVVAEFCENWEGLENGSLLIVITEDGVVAKRGYFYEQDRSILILKSDNSDYKTYTIPLDKVYEIWEIRGRISKLFSSDNYISTERLKTLEADMRTLKAQMRSIAGDQRGKEED